MVSFQTKFNYDEFGIEGTNEGYHDVFEEGLDKHNLYKYLRDENLDSRYEQDLSKYPDYFKIYNENYKKYEEINKNAERRDPGDVKDIFEIDQLRPQRSGAMRAWINKWDPDYNVSFRGVSSKVESN